MTALHSMRTKATTAFLLLFSFLLIQTDGPAGGAENSNVTITAEVQDAAPECQDTAAEVSFQPTFDGGLTFQLPSPALQSAYIDLDIRDGLSPDCAPITGRVAFSQTGFLDGDGGDALFLGTAINCVSGVVVSLAMPTAGIYTCGQEGVSSPAAIAMFVTVGEGAVAGVFTDTVSIDLIANP
jgi:hypothetical protein